MELTEFPEKGAEVRRIADGLKGEILACDPAEGLLTIRWHRGFWLEVHSCTIEEFACDWELTGEKSAVLKEFFKTFSAVSAFILVCSFLLIKSCDSSPTNLRSSHSESTSPSARADAENAAPDPYPDSFRDQEAKDRWRADAHCLSPVDSDRQACEELELAISNADQEFDDALAAAAGEVREVDDENDRQVALARAQLLQKYQSWDEMSQEERKEATDALKRTIEEGLSKHGRAREGEEKIKDQAGARYRKEVLQAVEAAKAPFAQ